MQAVGQFEQTASRRRPPGACGSACNGTSRGATAGLRHRSLGWVEDQVRTASRVATLIGRKFHLSPLLYSVSGATRLMHRLGSSPQAPARCVAERGRTGRHRREGGYPGGGERAPRAACGSRV
ncbi:helix-turn-helix domain-containing protein [Streptomyces sp. fd1-xmd]|uniref:helix-turn-helix domain-containing protein n=1 Tax=Streptomyces sp. fd1-xmd TaxID=1812480 RepID=UPI001CED7A8D|nr:winged helix-turn-helix domain-containing protein [Streptomyces sp. fd1-xmd]